MCMHGKKNTKKISSTHHINYEGTSGMVQQCSPIEFSDQL